MSAGQARDFGGMPLQDDTLSSSADPGANRHAGPSVAPAEGMRSTTAGLGARYGVEAGHGPVAE